MARSVQILNARGEPLSVAQRSAAQRVAAMNIARSTAYQAAGFGHPSTRNWYAPRVSGQSAVSQSRDVLTARTRDMVRNDSAMAAGLDKKVNNVVGGGLRLDADPNFEALGIAPEYREAIVTRIEMLWDEFANDHGAWIDAERNGNLVDLLLLWAHHLEADGECFLILPWRDEPSPTGFQTCVQTVHPARCSNPLGIMDRADLREGVALDAMGAAVGYYFRRAHPGDTFLRGKNQFQWDYFERDHDDGRPYVLHAFERNEAGVYRAISKLWSVLRKQMQGEQYFDSELQAAQLNAVMALFIETPFDQMELLDSMSPDKFAEHMSAVTEARETNPISMGGVQAIPLLPGEKQTLAKPEHPNAAFGPFMQQVLRSLASIIGITYEQLTMDWSQVNYSSARAAILEVAKGFKVCLDRIKQKLLRPLYWAFSQEIHDKGYLDDLIPANDNVPAFEDAAEAWTRCTWIGAGKGYVDPLKEVQAAGLRIALGLSTLKKECADQGEDYRRLIQQTASEIALWRAEAERYGLDPNLVPHPAYTGVPASSQLAKSIAANLTDNGDNDDRSSAQRPAGAVPLVRRAA